MFFFNCLQNFGVKAMMMIHGALLFDTKLPRSLWCSRLYYFL